MRGNDKLDVDIGLRQYDTASVIPEIAQQLSGIQSVKMMDTGFRQHDASVVIPGAELSEATRNPV